MARKSLQKSLQLGRAVEWPDSPEKAQLDRVPNPQADTNYLVRFTAPEFTSICPVTGQPDFAHLMIDYVPGQWLLESKSLKPLCRELPQSRRLPRGLHGHDRQADCRRDQAEMACASAATGIRAAASRSTCSGRPANCPRACGYPTRASRPIAGGANRPTRSVDSQRTFETCLCSSAEGSAALP